MRKHLEVAARHSPDARKKLVAPELPETFALCWIWFCELDQSRSRVAGPAGYIPGRIPYAEMQAWSSLTGRRLTPFETAVLRGIDALWLTPPDDDEEAA